MLLLHAAAEKDAAKSNKTSGCFIKTKQAVVFKLNGFHYVLQKKHSK